MPMKNPPHRGGFVRRQCIEPLGLTITDAAAALGVTRTTLSELVNGKRGISPEMAVRLSKVCSAESWLVQQAHYDLAKVHADRIKLKRLPIRGGPRNLLYQREKRLLPLTINPPIHRRRLIPFAVIAFARIEVSPRSIDPNRGQHVIGRLVKKKVVILVEKDRHRPISFDLARLRHHLRNTIRVADSIAV
jgi:addiction module HigA family antidote